METMKALRAIQSLRLKVQSLKLKERIQGLKLKLLVCVAPLVVFGCASAMNPYSENFTCPIMENGKCVPISQAYQESVTGQQITLEEKKQKEQSDYSPVEEAYRDALFMKLSNLLREPKTPLVVPPKVVRVMILPYQDATGKEFYSARYIYTIVEEPQWILQNLKALPPEEERGQ